MQINLNNFYIQMNGGRQTNVGDQKANLAKLFVIFQPQMYERMSTEYGERYAMLAKLQIGNALFAVA